MQELIIEINPINLSMIDKIYNYASTNEMIKSAWPVSSQFFGNKFLSDLFSQIFWRQRIKQPNKGGKNLKKWTFFACHNPQLGACCSKNRHFLKNQIKKGGKWQYPMKGNYLIITETIKRNDFESISQSIMKLPTNPIIKFPI